MGLFDRIRERLAPQREPAAVEPSVATRTVGDAEWQAPKGLDPHSRNLATLMMALRAQVAEMTPREAIRRMGVPFSFESEALVPADPKARTGWTDERMFKALSRDGDYMTMRGEACPRVLDAIDRSVVDRLAREPMSGQSIAERAYALRADRSSRVSDFVQGGARLDERVRTESEMLERQTSGVIEERFRDTPISSLVPLPDRGERRRAWLEDALRAEHAAATEGAMTPEAVVRAAIRPRGAVPMSYGGAPHIADRTAEIRHETAAEARRIEGMSDASLRLRFRSVPGTDGAAIPDASRAADRRVWVETLLLAQRVREAMPHDGKNIAGETIARSVETGQSAPVLVAEPRHKAPILQSFAVAHMMGR